MSLKTFDLVAQADNTWIATRRALTTPLSDGSKGVLDITLGATPTNTQTMIFGGQTWTFVTSATPGAREVTIAGSAALTAAAAAVNISAHAVDGLVFVATNPSGAIIRLTPIADSATIAVSAFGTATQSLTVRSGLNTTYAVPSSGAGITLVINDAVVTTKMALFNVLRTLLRIIRRDMNSKTLPSDLATTGTIRD